MVIAIENIIPTLQISPLRFIELVGPAGAGKSTLARVLCQRHRRIRIGTEIAFRKVHQLPILIGSIPLVLSSFYNGVIGGPNWTWDEMKFLVYLEKWKRVLEQQAKSHSGTILLDHGPVFKLATLHAFGPDWLRSAAADAWWRNLFQEWAELLDLIVWLDAPDALLETRINARNQKHQLKGRPESEVLQFLARYRSSYNYVLSGLAASNGPSVIHYDTSLASLDDIGEEILVACKIETTGV
jgi:energy-coupling factor transporter ATP-binding protein EcfA2